MELIQKVKKYVNNLFSINIEIEGYINTNKLPYLLLDNYYFFKSKLFNLEFLLAVPKENELTPATINKHFILIKNTLNTDCIYVASTIASFERQRLINYRIPFIIPDNQFFVPQLGMDLREYYKRKPIIGKKINPSTQVLLLYIIKNKITDFIGLKDIAKILQYSSMTISRAFDELESLHLANIVQRGRERFINSYKNPIQLWEEAQQYLISPIKKEIYVSIKNNSNIELFNAGISALMEYTLVGAPLIHEYAIGLNEYLALIKNNLIKELLDKSEAKIKLQLWKYSPRKLSNLNTVDKFSLYLSLKENSDDRIRIGLKELTKEF